MKKLLTIILAFAVSIGAFAFVGCGNKEEKENNFSDNSKPVMPTDKDMQTVATENIMQEIGKHYKQLALSGYGRYKAYASYEMNYKNNKNSGSSVNQDSETYGGIKNGGNSTAAYAFISVGDRQYKTAEGVVENNDYSEVVHTCIHKDTQFFRFAAHKSKDEIIPLSILSYEDNAAWEKVYSADIPCVAIGSSYVYTVYSKAINRIGKAVEYATQNTIYSLYEDVEWGETCQTTVESFELVAKKSDKKFFASAKYILDYQPTDFNYNTAKSVSEYSILIDYDAPKSASELPSSGVDINGLSLSAVAGSALYLDVTSRQLTDVVKEGKEISVDVVGNGNVSNFSAYGVHGNDKLTVSDGKIIIDGEKLKAKIEYEKSYNEIVNEFIIYCYIGYNYYYDNVTFSGKIYIDY